MVETDGDCCSGLLHNRLSLVCLSHKTSYSSCIPAATFPRRSPTLQDHADIVVPPSKEDFVMAGNLRKRRGGFGKMSQNKWKNRCFVLLKTGNLCYFQVPVACTAGFGVQQYEEPQRSTWYSSSIMVMITFRRCHAGRRSWEPCVGCS